MEKEEKSRFSYPAEILPNNDRSAAIREERNRIEQAKQEKLDAVSTCVLTGQYSLKQSLTVEFGVSVTGTKRKRRQRP